MSFLVDVAGGFRRNILLAGGAVWVAEGSAWLAGASAVPFDLTGIGLGAVAAIAAYPSVREGILRRIAGRPRRTMTPEDYERLAELERELGLCPDEQREEPDGRAAVRSLSSSGVVGLEAAGPGGCVCGESADPLWLLAADTAARVACYCRACGHRIEMPESRIVADEAGEHFAALARVGRESCLSYCPICADRLDQLMTRSVLGNFTDVGDTSIGDTSRWHSLSEMPELRRLDVDRWG